MDISIAYHPLEYFLAMEDTEVRNVLLLGRMMQEELQELTSKRVLMPATYCVVV